jgi:hypothetical protein
MIAEYPVYPMPQRPDRAAGGRQDLHASGIAGSASSSVFDSIELELALCADYEFMDGHEIVRGGDSFERRPRVCLAPKAF